MISALLWDRGVGMIGPCCPGKPVARRISIGGQTVGIAEFDAIIGRALDATSASDEELKEMLLVDLKRFNYVPAEMEAEYAQAIWQEFLECRSKGSGCAACGKR